MKSAKKRRASLGKMSHEEWYARYEGRAKAIYDRMHRLPEAWSLEESKPWWAPECPDELPTPVATSGKVWPWWHPDRPSDAPVVILERGLHQPWRGIGVDADLNPEWIERLNALPNVKIVHMCAGHPVGDGMLYPSIEFVVTHPEIPGGNGAGDTVHALIGEIFGDVAEAVAWETHPRGAGGYPGYPEKIIGMIYSWVPRAWMSLCQYISWWEQVIDRFERLAPELPDIVRTKK